MRVPLADSPLLGARVVREQRPIGISDPENSDLVDAKLIKLFGIKAMLGTPLIKGKESIGSLVANSTADDRIIDEYTLSRASALADSAAIAISNAQLYEQSRRLVEEMTAVARQSAEHYKLRSFWIEDLDRQHDEFDASAQILLSESAASEDVLAGIPHLSPALKSEQDYPIEKSLLQLGYRSRIVSNK